MVRALLACLLIHTNQLVSIERLTGALWRTPPNSSGANLRTYAARLREALAQVGLSGRLATQRGGGYRLTVRHGEIDADRFTVAAAQGQAALCTGDFPTAATDLSAALAMWRGRAGDDVPVNGNLVQHLGALNEHRLAVADDLVEARFALGQYQTVIRGVRAVLAEHPLRERPWAQLVRALYLAGDPGAALDAYHQARTALRDSLGIEPSTQLQQLQLAVLRRDDAAVAGPVRGTGPALPAMATRPGG